MRDEKSPELYGTGTSVGIDAGAGVAEVDIIYSNM